MGRPLQLVAVIVATVVTTEVVYRLSHFQYGVNSVFSESFDLVRFTLKGSWWLGAWFLYWWLFERPGRRLADRRRERGTGA